MSNSIAWNKGLTKETNTSIANASALKTQWHATHDTSGNNNPCAKQIDEKQLIDLYVNQGKSLQQCGDIIGLSKQAITNRLNGLGIAKRKPLEIAYNIVYDLYITQHKPIKECASLLDTTITIFRNRLKKYNITIRPQSEALRGQKFVNVNVSELLKLYNDDKLTIKDCAKHFNCTSPSIRKLLHESNIVTRPNKGDSHYNKGQTVPDSTRSKISLTLGGTGTPYEGTYDRNVFTEELKDQIRLRDHNQCQLCCKLQQESLDDIGRKLDVYHIDYDKSNCYSSNLIALCIDCHSPTNVNREYWKARLQKYQTERNII